jgi:hypothetical protein
MSDLSNDRLRRSCDEAVGLSVSRMSLLQHAVFALVLLCLIAIPTFLFVVVVSHDSKLHEVLDHITVFGFPLWAIFAVWVTLDASALYGLIGPRPDPLGPRALRLSALGLANVAAMFLFLILTKGK